MTTPRATSLCALAALSLAACARHSSQPPPLSPATNPSFETRIEIATATAQHSAFAVQDFNGDTRLDMVVVSTTGDLQVMLGSGAVFTTGQTIALGPEPIWITCGDFDRDGDCDLAVVRRAAGELRLLVNDGNAQFTVGQALAVGVDSLAVVAGDANDDHLLDLVVSRPSAPELQVYHGDGAGNFAAGAGIALPGGGSPFTVGIGDVTRDLRTDLLVCDSPGDRLLVYQGNTLDFNPVPIELAIPGRPIACSVGDLNGDGSSDIAVAVADAEQFVVITDFAVQTGPVAYTSFSVAVDGPPTLSSIGDVTGDGRADLVGCLNNRQSVVVIAQQPGGTLGAPFQLDATGSPLHPAIGDVDQDGHNDLLALAGGADRINLWLARPNGELIGSRNWDSGMLSTSYQVAADLDGDGLGDVAVGNNNDPWLTIMNRAPDGPVVPAATIQLGRPAFNVRSADLDGDGRVDLVVPVDNGVKVLRNTSAPGAISFAVLPGAGNVSFGVGAGPFGVAVADLNGDGRLDLAIADFAGGNLQLLLGSAADPFAFPGPPQILPIGGGPADVVAADFNGDGVPDLAVSRHLAADIRVLANDGSANLSPMVDMPVGMAPNYLVTSDFDGDHCADLVVSNGASASVTVLFGGAQGFAAVDYPAGATPTALLGQDLTDDGAPDILVASLVGGDFRVLVNDGHGGFGNLFPFPGVSGAASASLVDIEGDGDADLVIGSLISNRLSLITAVIP